jgi:ribosomal protein S18 acetylase RimI-like enzyme
MLTVRAATADDCDLILGYIRALAADHGEEDRVTADRDSLRTLLFGPHSTFTTEIALWNRVPCGLMIWSPFASTMRGRAGIHLEDLYVEPRFRGRGIGRDLMVHLARTCTERGYFAIEWSVHPDNERGAAFYQRLGAEPFDDFLPWRLSEKAMRWLARDAT